MILVTGTMRSGTSMWMQILIAAGLPHLGEAFPAPWGDALRPANRHGFFESQLVAGIYHATNPQPESGAYLFPQQTRTHAVKVFIPGLVRSDVAFLDRVIATVRGWREYATSLQTINDLTGNDREAELFDVPLSPSLRWWVENFALVRDIATRRYPAHVTTYSRLLAAPQREIEAVLGWVGQGNARAAVDVVDPSMRTVSARCPTPTDISPTHAQVFDDLYTQIHEGRDFSHSFIEALNQTDRELRPRLSEARNRNREQLVQRLAQASAS